MDIPVAEGNILVDGMQVIPDMDVNMGRSWRQPLRPDIQFEVSADMTMPIIKNIPVHAYMWEADFEGLSDYSRSTPSGVYPGKMWKADWGGKWHLVWFADSERNPGLECSIHHCPILLLDVIAMLNPGG